MCLVGRAESPHVYNGDTARVSAQSGILKPACCCADAGKDSRSQAVTDTDSSPRLAASWNKLIHQRHAEGLRPPDGPPKPALRLCLCTLWSDCATRAWSGRTTEKATTAHWSATVGTATMLLLCFTSLNDTTSLRAPSFQKEAAVIMDYALLIVYCLMLDVSYCVHREPTIHVLDNLSFILLF